MKKRILAILLAAVCACGDRPVVMRGAASVPVLGGVQQQLQLFAGADFQRVSLLQHVGEIEHSHHRVTAVAASHNRIAAAQGTVAVQPAEAVGAVVPA